MMPANTNPKILCLSFEKEGPTTLLYEFETLLIFGISQTFGFFTPIEFLDYAIPENSIKFKESFHQDSNAEFKQLCHRFQCTHILYGTLITDQSDNFRLKSLLVEIRLYDLARNTSTLMVQYPFRAFEVSHTNLAFCMPVWEGFQNLIKWTVFQVVGAIQPIQALSTWKQVQNASVAPNLQAFQELANAHYLAAHVELPQRVAAFASIIQANPHSFLAYLELGHLYKRMQNYSQAIFSLERALKLMDGVCYRARASCATEIGVCYALAGNNEQAFHWWETAIDEDPTFVNPYMNLAHAHEGTNNILKAERYFKQAATIAKDDVRVYFNLARLYSKLEQWDKAITQYERQLQLESDNAWVCSNIANCYLQKGDIYKAKAHLKRTIEIDPEGEAGKYASQILSGLQAVEV